MGGGQRGYRIGAEEAAGGQILPVALANPLENGVARALVSGTSNKHDATRTNYVTAGLYNNGQQPNHLARTITTGTGKRYDPDTESVVVSQKEESREEDRPRKRRVIKRASACA